MLEYEITQRFGIFPDTGIEPSWVFVRAPGEEDDDFLRLVNPNHKRMYKSVMKKIIRVRIVLNKNKIISIYRGGLAKYTLRQTYKAPDDAEYLYMHIDAYGNVTLHCDELRLFHALHQNVPHDGRIDIYKYPLNSLYYDHDIYGYETSWKRDYIAKIEACDNPEDFYRNVMRITYYENYKIDANGNRYDAIAAMEEDTCCRSLYEIKTHWEELRAYENFYMWGNAPTAGEPISRYCGTIGVS